MTERTVMRKQHLEVQRNLQMRGIDDDDSDLDSVATESTAISEHDNEKVYDVDRIVAEKVLPDGTLRYLLLWTNYPEESATWEPPENIMDQDDVIGAWKARLEQEKAGQLKAFDVAAYELKVARLKKEHEQRVLRRKAKREKLARRVARGPGKAMTAYDSDDEPLLGRRSHKGVKSVQQSEGEDDEDDMPLASLRRSSMDNPVKKKHEKAKRPRKDSEESDAASSDSMMAEIKDKEARRRASAMRNREVPSKSKPKTATKNLLEKQRGSDTRSISQRSTDSPDARSPLLKTRELPKPPSRTASRDLTKETQPPSMNTGHQSTIGIPPPRPRGRPRGSGRGGATRGGRAGRLPATSNVFSRSAAPKAKPRGLSNALSGIPIQNDQNNQPDLSKKFSHARKLEMAGRSKADRAPDLNVIGGLVNPADIKAGSRTAYQQLKPLDSRRTSIANTDPIVTNPQPTSRRSSTTRVRFIDDSDDAPRPIFDEPSPIVENQSLQGRSDRDTPSKVQMVGAQGNGQSDTSGQMRIKPRPILRTPSSNQIPSEKSFQPPTQPRADTMPSMASTRNIPYQSAPAFQATPQLREDTMSLLNASNQTMPVRPVSGKKKVSMSEYQARQGIEKSAHLVKQATFGKLGSQILIAFSGVARNSQEPWAKEIGSIDVLNFSTSCLATHFKAQPSFVNAQVLAHGSIATNADATSALDRQSENLRLKLGGLIFSHKSTAILLFPTRLEEWKFLEEVVDLPNVVTFRYHIFKLPDFASEISAPATDAVSKLVALPPSWSSVVEFLCEIKYDYLLPPLPVKSKGKPQEQDRDNFFLLVPETATPSLHFLTKWLKSCKPSCKILTCKKDGSWNVFMEHVRKPKSAGAVIVHEEFLHIIPSLPDLQLLFDQISSNFAIYSISNCPAFARTRLFPHGGAFFLAPSILYADPRSVLKFLNWFQKKEENSTPGSYQLLGCHGMRELLLDIANEKARERKILFEYFNAQAPGRDPEQEAKCRGLGHSSISFRYCISETIDDMIDTAEKRLPAGYDLSDVDEDERPIVYASELISKDDEPKLVQWFAEWAMQNLDKYRKFWFIGTDPSNVRKSVPWYPTSNLTETSSTDSAAIARPVSPKSPLDNSARWKKSGFTAVKEVAPAPLFSTVVSKSRPDDNPISPLTSNPVSDEPSAEKERQENWIIEERIQSFLDQTGVTDDDVAISFLIKSLVDVPKAVRRYRESLDLTGLAPSQTPTPHSPATHPPQLGSVDDPNSHDAASGSRSTSRPSSRSGAVTEENGRRHVPSSTRSDGSVRPEIEMRPGYMPPEDKEVWKSPSVLSMLPRNVRQNAAVHITDSRQRPNEDIGRTIQRDESGDVVMSEINHHVPSDSPANPDNNAAAIRKGSDSSGMFVSECERSQSPSTSPVKTDVAKSWGASSTTAIESSTEWYERKHKAKTAWSHVNVYGINETFKQLGIPYKG